MFDLSGEKKSNCQSFSRKARDRQTLAGAFIRAKNALCFLRNFRLIGRTQSKLFGEGKEVTSTRLNFITEHFPQCLQDTRINQDTHV